MPHKDPEAHKKYQAEQMRRRRAQAKATKQAGDNLPPATQGVVSPPELPGKKSKLNLPAPASQKSCDNIPVGIIRPLNEPVKNVVAGPEYSPPASQDEMSATEKFWQTCGIVNIWPKYPDQEGYPCANGLGRCCLPLMWEENHAIKHCTNHIKYCIYFRRTQAGMELMN